MKKGFSLTEWMVLIAIVAVIIAIAIPSYKSYESKKMLANVNVLLQHQFDALVDRYTNGQTEAITLNNPLPTITSLVSTPTSTGGTVVVHFSQSASLNKAFASAPIIATYVATKNNNVLTWACSSLTSTGTIDRADRATISTKFLTKPQCH